MYVCVVDSQPCLVTKQQIAIQNKRDILQQVYVNCWNNYAQATWRRWTSMVTNNKTQRILFPASQPQMGIFQRSSAVKITR